MNPNDYRVWLQFAEEDLDSAQLITEKSNHYRQACFLIQQSVEKSIKACYVKTNQQFLKTHDLNALRDQLNYNFLWKKVYPNLSQFIVYAVEARYPGDWEEIDFEEANSLLLVAKKILESIKKELSADLTP
ncbi:HEPN domain protein [Leptospira yanagawae serovar Saopaulo str. Sao Paulo = ATCC 700523]|uniref:HEPN domain protein n=1 Tax=Leptospira yanagawae serovar Saopaulo str. Sao Paulo = ATCC 700523 TaxID=1249483 RepID=A0A5E8HF84_9LEPT|nr:HEPN domain-containing protein [Leptospira yanagawae]EOQ89457.1 HEPN domain protein [Leptospira yanagawae serovar Saopaulo str. Sao Paulo = ATCC 700523]